MAETIYTIPINEAFDKAEDSEKPICPFCELYEMLENNALEAVMGAAMMEPDIRIETNKHGFCRGHFNRIYEKGNRLGLALILESHIAEVNEKVFKKPLFDGKGEKSEAAIEKLEESCYLCNKIAYSLTKMYDNTIYIWETDEDFRRKFKNQRCFCLPHYKKMLQYGRSGLDKKQFIEFFDQGDIRNDGEASHGGDTVVEAEAESADDEAADAVGADDHACDEVGGDVGQVKPLERTGHHETREQADGDAEYGLDGVHNTPCPTGRAS